MKRIWILAAAAAMAMTACGDNAGPQASGGDPNSITLSYSQVVADELPFWIADEAGLFKAQGLDVKLTNLSSSDGFPALISGQTQLASIGAPEMVSGAASGGQVSYLATLTPVFIYELFTKLKTPQELKGKRVGITSTSGSLYIATLEALHQLGLQPSDVALTPLGSVTNVNNALVAGTIDAALSHPPTTTQLEAEGFHSMLDLATQNIPTSNVGIAATDAYVQTHGDQIRNAIGSTDSEDIYTSSISLTGSLAAAAPDEGIPGWTLFGTAALGLGVGICLAWVIVRKRLPAAPAPGAAKQPVAV